VRISGGIAAALCAAFALTAATAGANGRYPASTAVRFSVDPAGLDLIVVRTTYGLLVSHDDGASWRWLCEGALGVPAMSIEDPSLELTAGGALVIGVQEGLDVSRDFGCNFGCVNGPPAGLPIVDLAWRPSDPHAVLALSSIFVFDDAGASHDARVWESTDDGATFVARSALDPTIAPSTIDGAPSDPARIYVSGTRGLGSSSTAVLLVSTDRGATWTERPIPFDPQSEVQVFIGAVDPKDADRVYLRSSGSARLYVTSDAGRTFQVPLVLSGPMLGLALSPDGSKVYAGGPQDGLFAASMPSADAGLSFTRVSNLPVQCLATRGDELWACADDSSGFTIGSSTNGGAHFVPRMRKGQLAGPIACVPEAGPFACEANANASQCAGAAFEAVCSTLQGCDAGPAAAGQTRDSGVSTQAVPLRSSNCGCSQIGGPNTAGLALGTTLAALLARLARWRRRRSD
jgi:hypothetical protein